MAKKQTKKSKPKSFKPKGSHQIPHPAELDALQQSFNITVAGFFNPHIVQPAWALSNKLIPKGDFRILMPVGGQQVPTYVCDQLLWRVNPDRLIVFGDANTGAEFIGKLLEILRHTPVRGAGINFGRVISSNTSPADHATALAGLIDGEVQESAEIKVIELPGEVKLTVRVDWTKSGRKLTANFHIDATDYRLISSHVKRFEEFGEMMQELEERLG